jgi:lipooligosaccharide transport system permease protein
VLTGLAFAVPVFGYTARQQDEDGFNILYRLVITPLMLFSATFFPIEQLPALLRPVAWITPLWHGVEASRAAAFGQPVTWAFALHVLVLAAFVAAGWVWALRGFTKRLVT